MQSTIFFYGGSFNPPHIGHVLAIAYLACRFPNDRILVAPILRHAYNKELLDFEIRWEMLKLALETIPSAELTTLEKDLDLPTSRTIDCLDALNAQYPGVPVRVVIGSDLANDLHRWKDAENLMKRTNFFIFPRTGYPHETDEYVPYLPEISSSHIRRLLAEGQVDACKGWLPQRVLDFIVKHKLYAYEKQA